jgi:hypothetical protein
LSPQTLNNHLTFLSLYDLICLSRRIK